MSPVAKSSSGKDHAKRRKVSHPVGIAPSSSAAGHLVSQSSLPWSTVQLPGEAVATGGFTEQDFFEGLNDAEDDFMGLKEVEGVQVVYQAESSGGKTVKFIVGDAPGKSKVGDAPEVGPTPSRAASHAPEPPRTKKRKQNKRDQAKHGEYAVALQLAEAQTRISKETCATPSQQSEESNSEDSQDVSNNTFDIHRDAALAGVFSAAVHKVGDGDLDEAPFDDRLLPAWKNLGICSALKRGLLRLSFNSPTAIQSATLPHALGRSSNVEGSAGKKRHRDIVGVAQTGSGKTLAYGLPILQYLIEQRHELATYTALGDFKPLTALVLAPTRELALQVSDHLRKVVEAVLSDPDDVAGASRPPHFAQIATVCGGMSIQKQRRQLERGSGADVIIATPGRIWELLREDDHLARRVKQVRFLVVDEADRMIETGHFAEMEQILSLVKVSEATEEPLIAAGDALIQQQIVSSALGGQDDMQTFVFSATLSKELQKNLKKGSRRHRHSSTSTLDELMDRIDFRDDDPLVVDLSPNTGVAEGLTEAKVECLNSEKDLYLYYILLRYPGRTLVFVNSIDSIRRLHPILVNLGLHVFPLHSQLQQKQRLKHLDRFRSTALSKPGSVSTGKTASSPSSVLLATDVAARGLDIPAVDHVVHYQIPRSADTYVHRSGRTARAGKSGVAIALVEPSEKRLWRDLCRSLKKCEEVRSLCFSTELTEPNLPGTADDTAILPIEYSFLASLRERLTLSRQIDQAQHKQAKISHDSAWLRDLAEGADLDLVSDMELSEDDDGARKLTDPRKGGKAAQAARAKVARLRGQLEDLLARPLSARGVSHRYLTSGSTGFVDDLISNTHHEAMIGVATSTAQSDLGSVKSASTANRAGKGSKAAVERGTAASKRQSATPSTKRKRPLL